MTPRGRLLVPGAGVAALSLAAGLSTVCCAVEGTVLREVDDDTMDGAPALSGDAATGDATTALDASAQDGDAGSRFPADAARGDASGIFAGQFFSCDLAAGTASCWGSDQLGQLGTGSLQDRLSPAAVADAPGFTLLSAGESHACGLAFGTATMFCWGSDADGQLGQGGAVATLDASTADPTSLPVTLPLPASTVGLGYDHPCAILTDGSLWCWGLNSEGQLGQDDPFTGPNFTSPQRVGTASDWRDVSGGQGSTCGIRGNGDAGAAGGTLWCWGRNRNSELGLGSGAAMQIRTPTQVGTSASWVQVEVGQDDGCAIRTDGTLWCWGSNGSGQLTPAVGTTVEVPTQIGTDTDWAYVNTDTFVTCGLKTGGDAGGALLCWGRNAEGQLGVGDNTGRTSPTATGDGATFAGVSVGRSHTGARTVAGEILCAGDDESGQLGVGDTEGRNVFSPVTSP